MNSCYMIIHHLFRLLKIQIQFNVKIKAFYSFLSMILSVHLLFYRSVSWQSVIKKNQRLRPTEAAR